MSIPTLHGGIAHGAVAYLANGARIEVVSNERQAADDAAHVLTTYRVLYAALQRIASGSDAAAAAVARAALASVKR